jgi:hypothetical protein
MTTYYDREFPVSKWIIGIDLTEKQEEIITKISNKKGGWYVKWPALEMPEELKKLASEGYAEQINQPMPFFLDLTLALRAMVNITRRNNPFAPISNKPQYHHLCNNRIANEKDFIRLANEILAANDPITLSQVFDTAEKTHLSVFSLDADKKAVQKIASKVITLGNGSEFDINLSDLNPKDLQAAIITAF